MTTHLPTAADQPRLKTPALTATATALLEQATYLARGTQHHPLGALVAEHRQAPCPPRILVWFSLFLGVVCGAMGVAIWSRVAEGQALAFGLVGLSGGFLLTAAAVHRARRLHRDDCVLLYEHGLEYVSKNRLQSLRWDEVETVYRGEMAYRSRPGHFVYPFFKLRTADGRLVRIGGPFDVDLNRQIADVAQLARGIEAATYRHLLPREFQRYRRGEVLDFGQFSVSQEGVHVRRRIVPWSEVEGLRTGATLINGRGFTALTVVGKKGTGLFTFPSPPLIAVPNLLALYAVFEEACPA